MERLNRWLTNTFSKRLLWLIAGLALGLLILMGVWLRPWWQDLASGRRIGLGVVWLATFLSVSGLLAWLLILLKRQEAFQQQGRIFQDRIATAERYLKAVLALNQNFVKAQDEYEIVDHLLKFVVEEAGALAASLVPLDERGQPMTSMDYGELPTPLYKAWVEYLASPQVRQRCSNCQNHSSLKSTCPLVNAPFPESVAVYCLPLKRGEREFGILNVYLPRDRCLSEDIQAFLRTVVDETAMVLEGIRLRRREAEAIERLKGERYQTDLKGLLKDFLEYIRGTLKMDFVFLSIPHKMAGDVPLTISVGNLSTSEENLIKKIAQDVLDSEAPLLLDNNQNACSEETRISALISAPLWLADGTRLGAILSGNFSQRNFTRRHLSHLASMAEQIALVIQDFRQVAEIEYRATIAERNRLAREIHDGLAQTIGFLKLQAAQMNSYLEQGKLDKLRETLQFAYQTLAEAYQEVRQAIDSLRMKPASQGLMSWLERTVTEFSENTGLDVSLEDRTNNLGEIAPEVQAQLIRIVQEALSNIRKHAHAQRAWVSLQIKEGRLLVLEVGDDGSGFSPEDVPRGSRHGLQGMQERAELISANLQVISRPHEGTIVRICLPLLVEEQSL